MTSPADLIYGNPSQSVEEAGALLGAAITRCGVIPQQHKGSMSQPSSEKNTPTPSRNNSTHSGMMNDSFHGSTTGSTTGTEVTAASSTTASILSTQQSISNLSSAPPVASSELYVRLLELRNWLRKHDEAGRSLDDNQDTCEAEMMALSEEYDEGSGYMRGAAAVHAFHGRRSASAPPPHPAAPSLLAVLVKLLTVSSTSGGSGGAGASSVSSSGGASASSSSGSAGGGSSSGGSSSSAGRSTPMLSNAIRKLWAESVLLCHRLGYASVGGGILKTSQPMSAVDVCKFMRTMMEIVAVNPRSSKAAGGTRLAALESIIAFFSDPLICTRVAPWALEVLQMCHRGLRSSGSYEPHHRALCVACAAAVAVGCRRARVAIVRESSAASGEDDGGDSRGVTTFLCVGAMEERAVHEAVRTLRRATDDTYPEVRCYAGKLACALAPVLVHRKKHQPAGGPSASMSSSASVGSTSGSSTTGAGANAPTAASVLSPLSYLEDVMQVCIRNIDDERPGVAVVWSEAFARCICSAIDCAVKLGIILPNAKGVGKREFDDAGFGDDGSSVGGSVGATESVSSTQSASNVMINKLKSFQESRRSHGSAVSCSSVLSSVDYVVTLFLKSTGGNCGGPFSSGGRAPRVGFALTLTNLVQLQTSSGAIGGKFGVSMKDLIKAILNMVGPKLMKQIGRSSPATESSSSSTSGKSSTSSPSWRSGSRQQTLADAAPLARLSTCLVLRRGLGERSSEQAQQMLVRDLADLCQKALTEGFFMNEHQLQVALVEISNIVSALGEAAASTMEYLIPTLEGCIAHPDHGVRYEAATVYAALARMIPRACNGFINTAINNARAHKDHLMIIASEGAPALSPEPKKRFRRKKSVTEAAPGTWSSSSGRYLTHQYALHGNALVISMLLHAVPEIECDFPVTDLERLMDLIEDLVVCQYDDNLAKNNPGAACTVVRAGFCMTSASFTMGAKAVAPHIVRLFQLWQNAGTCIEKSATKYFSPPHDLICLEALISSVAAFLRFCSELLLSVPEALNRTTLLLESLLPLIVHDGRLGGKPGNPAATVRLDSVKASFMEAFSWLPPGSYPLAADQLFSMAARIIKEGTEEDYASSILPSLVSNEDCLLDAQSSQRALYVEQIDGATDLEDLIVALRSEAANPIEREAVLHSLPWRQVGGKGGYVMGSPLLGYVDSDGSTPPTPLHDVGTWVEPPHPCPSSKIQLLDSAIHAFAGTFGLQDGQEQEEAMLMLQSLLPQETTRNFSVGNALMSETDKKVKSIQENDIATNIVATISACLKALPRHLGSHDASVGMGPPWMRVAKDILVALLSSSSSLTRRASAEGLALLSTCGISEDAVSLPSSIFIAIQEIIDSPTADVKRKAADSAAFSKASALLTVGCLQRTSYRYARAKDKSQRKSRTSSSLPRPGSRMLRSVIEYLSNSNVQAPSHTRIWALHALGMLLINYDIDPENVDADVVLDENVKLAFGVLEDMFITAWTAVSADLDRNREAEKFASEPALLSVMARFATSLLPHLHLIESTDATVCERLVCMISSMVEFSDHHPRVVTECLAFFKRFSTLRQDKQMQSVSKLEEESVCAFVSLSLAVIHIRNISPLPETGVMENMSCKGSPVCRLGAVMCINTVVESFMSESSERSTVGDLLVSSLLHCRLLAFLEVTHEIRYFSQAARFRSVAAPRATEREIVPFGEVERETISSIVTLFKLDAKSKGNDAEKKIMRWLLLSRYIITGPVDKGSRNALPDTFTVKSVVALVSRNASIQAATVLPQGGMSRWQVKLQATNLCLMCLEELAKRAAGARNIYALTTSTKWKESPHFSQIAGRTEVAKLCKEANEQEEDEDEDEDHEDSRKSPTMSYLSLHLEALLSGACAAATATSDQAELPSLQNGGIQFLTALIWYFGDAVDPDCVASDPKNGGELILSQFTSQIVSSVRHSLDDSMSMGSMPELFLSGCEALVLLLKKPLIRDPSVLKRLLRPILPSDLRLPFGAYPRSSKHFEALCLRPKATSSSQNVTSLLFDRVARLGTFGKLRVLDQMGLLYGNKVSSILDDCARNEDGLAMHAGALAVDAARLNRDGAVPRSPSKRDGMNGVEKTGSAKKGLTYANLDDVNDMTVHLLTHRWSVLAAYSVSKLQQGIQNRGSGHKDEESDNMSRKEWIKKISPMLFVGLRDSLKAMNARQSPEKRGPPWSMEMTPDQNAAFCIFGIRSLVKSVKSMPTETARELDDTLQLLSKNVLLPSVKMATNTEDNGGQNTSTNSFASKDLIVQSCGLMEDMCSPEDNIGECFSFKALLSAILLPLVAFQKGLVKLDSDQDVTAILVGSCLRSAHFLISPSCRKEHKKILSDLSMSIIDVSATLLSRIGKRERSLPRLKETASATLRYCFTDSPLGSKDKKAVCRRMAQMNNWHAWTVCCASMEDGAGIMISLEALKDAFCNGDSPMHQMDALVALRLVLQEEEGSKELLAVVMQGMGGDILQLLKNHGLLLTSKKGESNVRMAICTDVVRLLVLSFQRLLSEDGDKMDESMTEFLSVTFRVLIHVISFNGLPNDEKKNEGADPDIGRLCAQTIVHFARSSASTFKVCVGAMTSEERGILETAMRAEISGYPNTGRGRDRDRAGQGRKGKINFQAFKT